MNIQTQRLTLRPLEAADAQAIFSYRSDADMNRYQSWIPQSLKEVEQFIQRTPDQFNQTGTWFQLALIRKDDQKLIGDLGIHFKSEEEAELGCTIANSQQKNGFAFEALQAVIDILKGEYGKARFYASLDPRNTASVRLFEKLGFQKEALHEKRFQIRGEWVDDLVYVLFFVIAKKDIA